MSYLTSRCTQNRHQCYPGFLAIFRLNTNRFIAISDIAPILAMFSPQVEVTSSLNYISRETPALIHFVREKSSYFSVKF
jgi:hypothetical protein